MKSTSDAAIAFHEAGHAIVAHALGDRVLRISIVPGVESRAEVQWDNPNPVRGLVARALEFDDADKFKHVVEHAIIEHAIIVCMAGPLAQRRRYPRSHWRQAATGTSRLGPLKAMVKGADYQQASVLAEQLHPNAKVSRAHWRYLEARADDLLTQWWPEVERLATALLERKTITEDLREIIQPPSVRQTAARKKLS